MVDFIIGPLLVFLMFSGWLLVQAAARAFAKRHPELGPYREEGSDCAGGGCRSCGESEGCGASACDLNQAPPREIGCGKGGCC